MGRGPAPDHLATVRALGILNDEAARKAWQKREAFLAWLVRINPKLAFGLVASVIEFMVFF